MKLKDILAKLAKGESLTADELKFVGGYDPDTEVNNAAAAARRKAEQDATDAAKRLSELQSQFDGMRKQLDEAGKAKMSDAEKSAQAISDLQKQMAELSGKLVAAETEKRTLARQATVQSVIAKSGIKFVDGVDGEVMSAALAGRFRDVADADLAQESIVKPILESFRSANKTVIVDGSGHGAGSSPKNQLAPTGLDGKPIEMMTPAERQADMKKRGII